MEKELPHMYSVKDQEFTKRPKSMVLLTPASCCVAGLFLVTNSCRL